MKIRKGDKVKILCGKDKGVKSIVERVYKDKNTVVVENVNVVSRHLKPSRQNKGGIIKISRPVHVSNVSVICPKCSKPTRVGYKTIDKKKYRLCKKCGEVIK